VHDSLAGEKLDALLKALQGAGGGPCQLGLSLRGAWRGICPFPARRRADLQGSYWPSHVIVSSITTCPGPETPICTLTPPVYAGAWEMLQPAPSTSSRLSQPQLPVPCLAGVAVHGGERAAAVLGLPAAPAPRHEYSSMDVTLELVPSLDAAVDHIHKYGSGHTESIITGGRAELCGASVDGGVAC